MIKSWGDWETRYLSSVINCYQAGSQCQKSSGVASSKLELSTSFSRRSVYQWCVPCRGAKKVPKKWKKAFQRGIITKKLAPIYPKIAFHKKLQIQVRNLLILVKIPTIFLQKVWNFSKIQQFREISPNNVQKIIFLPSPDAYDRAFLRPLMPWCLYQVSRQWWTLVSADPWSPPGHSLASVRPLGLVCAPLPQWCKEYRI